MLTITKPVQYGYGPVHDLPTPPSTSRPSPPLIYKDSSYKSTLTNPRDSSPLHQPMSAPHRGLPPPAALPPVQPPPGSGLSQPPVSGPPPPPPQQNQSYTQLPLPPSWHGNEESMQYWLKAKAEEDKRKQEEEKTRQESFRLEQRKMEHEILRTSLHGGIPPPLVPVVFAGMGGGALSPQAWELAQQFLPPHQQQHPPALMPSGAIASEHQRRDSQAQGYGQYPTSGGVPSTPGSAQGPTSSYMAGYPGSPTRPRGQSMPGRPPSNLPNLNTNLPGGPGGGPATASHPGIAHSQHQDAQPSPSIYFHHWQPPTTQAGGTRSGTDQPGTPSVGESPRKRKAAGPQPPIPPPSTAQRLRSPPFQHSAALSNPPPGRRRGHSRQRSDLGSYRAGGRGLRGESSGPGREMSPMHTSGASSARESEPSSSSQAQQGQQLHRAPPPQPAPMRTGAHSVSSLLSDTPQSPQPPTHQFAVSSEPRQFGQQQQQQQQQRQRVQAQQQQNKSAQKAKSPQASDPIVEQKITQLLNSMRAKTSEEPSQNNTVLNIPRPKKDEDDMDEDERLLASEEGKKLSSKERRQLRNKVSARAFRSRRKEYITQLESEIANKVTENGDLRAQNRALVDENKRLTDLTRMLLGSPSFSDFLNQLSANPQMLPQSQPQQTSQPEQQRQLPKDINPYAAQQQLHNQQIGLAMVPEQVDFSSLVNMEPSDGFSYQPQVFAVLETPEPIFDANLLSGKTSNFVGQQFDSDDDDKDMPVIEQAPTLAEAKKQEPAPINEEFENNPDFVLYHDSPAPTESVTSPVELDVEALSQSVSELDTFSGIEPEKALSRYELVNTTEDEAVADRAVARIQRLTSKLDCIASRLEMLGVGL